MRLPEWRPPANLQDFVQAFCGEPLGAGIARRVYAFRLDHTCVVKVEDTTNHDWQNIHEWEVWLHSGRKTSKWLAPCVSLSPAGSVLIQKRAEPLTRDRLPKLVPSFLADLRIDNWGWLDGRPVAIDYGRHNLFSAIDRSILVKAEWD